jgi:hypothetical protein
LGNRQERERVKIRKQTRQESTQNNLLS